MLRKVRTQEERNFKQRLLAGGFGVVTILCLSYVALLQTPLRQYIPHYEKGTTIDYTQSRKLLGSYPTDAFSENALENGAVIFHVLGLFYMFLAIAIVCDEFFVPAIEVIVDKLQMSSDTAGATFMAAGGSAPELFTSFIGTFITHDDVGFGTIVGSAVFNVLFVIGCCAVFSSGDLVLTWWPFARDSCYYCLSLLMLAVFFGIASADKIMWWEALILLFMYGGYVTLMMNNTRIWGFIKSKIDAKNEAKGKGPSEANQLRVARPLQFTVSIFDLMTRDATLNDIAGIHMVARIKGDVKATFREVDTDGSNGIDKEEFSKALGRLGRHITDSEVEDCFKTIDEDNNGTIDFEEFQRWYLRSTWRMKQDVETVFAKFDRDDDGFIDVSELYELLKAVNKRPPDMTEINEAKKLLDENDDGKISWDEFLNWYEKSVFFEQEKMRRETIVSDDEKKEEEGIRLTPPSNKCGLVLWCISIPIVFFLYFTVPDVRKPRWTSWYPVAFIMSIVWLAIYSYLMVWWATVFGDTVGIPSVVMGLTLLAAGTSVPDLLTSIIVARNGEGDMAVSSSIGSNIFDVLVGLPLPWFLYGISHGGNVQVGADSLFLSIFILFAMIAIVLSIIKCNKWRMTPMLGYSMFVLYVLFVIQDLLRSYSVIG